ncbi:hypothetical protein ACFLQZ_04220 [Acidobacteriota bacterium]
MTLKKHLLCTLSLLFILVNLSLSLPQQTQNPDQRVIVKPGISAEYFSLTIGWDEDVNSSQLKSYLFSTNTEISINDGFSIHLILGYSLSNYDNLTFRELPFSVELGVKEIGGILLGSEINKRLFYLSEYEINLYGQFVYYYGFNNEWNIPDLNVEGTLTGIPTWMRTQIGPSIRYEGLNNIFPFIRITYNKLWGTFTVDQDIQDLFGTEEKKIQGKSNLSFSFGSEFEVTPNLFLKGALSLLPYDGGIDFHGLISIQYVMLTQNRRTP